MDLAQALTCQSHVEDVGRTSTRQARAIFILETTLEIDTCPIVVINLVIQTVGIGFEAETVMMRYLSKWRRARQFLSREGAWIDLLKLAPMDTWPAMPGRSEVTVTVTAGIRLLRGGSAI